MDKIKSIEEYGRVYVSENLKFQVGNRDLIYNDWHKSLDFVFSKVFYRGRRDELSERFMNAVLETLKKFHLAKNYDKSLLEIRLKENGVNNLADRTMVAEMLDFVFSLSEFYKNNLVRYSVEKIKNGEIAEVFSEFDKIFAIGDKLASFYLRDVVLVFKLENNLKLEDFFYCQPIDTWARQVAIKLKMIDRQEKKNEEIKLSIIKACKKADVSPLLFNAGAWMVGAKSFDLLIERL